MIIFIIIYINEKYVFREKIEYFILKYNMLVDDFLNDSIYELLKNNNIIIIITVLNKLYNNNMPDRVYKILNQINYLISKLEKEKHLEIYRYNYATNLIKVFMKLKNIAEKFKKVILYNKEIQINYLSYSNKSLKCKSICKIWIENFILYINFILKNSSIPGKNNGDIVYNWFRCSVRKLYHFNEKKQYGIMNLYFINMIFNEMILIKNAFMKEIGKKNKFVMDGDKPRIVKYHKNIETIGEILKKKNKKRLENKQLLKSCIVELLVYLNKFKQRNIVIPKLHIR